MCAVVPMHDRVRSAPVDPTGRTFAIHESAGPGTAQSAYVNVSRGCNGRTLAEAAGLPMEPSVAVRGPLAPTPATSPP